MVPSAHADRLQRAILVCVSTMTGPFGGPVFRVISLFVSVRGVPIFWETEQKNRKIRSICTLLQCSTGTSRPNAALRPIVCLKGIIRNVHLNFSFSANRTAKILLGSSVPQSFEKLGVARLKNQRMVDRSWLSFRGGKERE